MLSPAWVQQCPPDGYVGLGLHRAVLFYTFCSLRGMIAFRFGGVDAERLLRFLRAGTERRPQRFSRPIDR